MSESGTNLLLVTVFKLDGGAYEFRVFFRRYLLAGFLATFFFLVMMILLLAWLALSFSHNS